jgi:hypothetical protein
MSPTLIAHNEEEVADLAAWLDSHDGEDDVPDGARAAAEWLSDCFFSVPQASHSAHDGATASPDVSRDGTPHDSGGNQNATPRRIEIPPEFLPAIAWAVADLEEISSAHGDEFHSTVISSDTTIDNA